MPQIFDAIVLGSGVVGASTAFHLAKLGGLRVCVVERGQICSGGTAKSCAIIRSHYSVASNTALTLTTLQMFDAFTDWLEDAEADCGFVRSGYLILAPEGDFADRMQANLVMQADQGAETFVLTREEARGYHPWLALDDVALIGYEPNSGYADPYLTTASLLRAARAKGVVVKADCPAERILIDQGSVRGVATAEGEIHAPLVVSAIGPWTPELLEPLSVDAKLEVSRHIVLTFRAGEPYGRLLPVVKDLTTANKMYFRPSSGGVVLVGTGDHGDPVTGPDRMEENITDDFVLLQGGQITHRMAGFAETELIASWVGAYDITPDWNPVLGSVEGIEGLTVAYGFSGHGFKLGPAVGKVLAQGILGLAQDVDISAYRHSRFADGALLTGAYGIGSIS